MKPHGLSAYGSHNGSHTWVVVAVAVVMAMAAGVDEVGCRQGTPSIIPVLCRQAGLISDGKTIKAKPLAAVVILR